MYLISFRISRQKGGQEPIRRSEPTITLALIPIVTAYCPLEMDMRVSCTVGSSSYAKDTICVSL